MDIAIGSRFKHAWNAFRNNGQQNYYRDIGTGYSYRPDRPRLTRGNERSIVTSVYNRIALMRLPSTFSTSVWMIMNDFLKL